MDLDRKLKTDMFLRICRDSGYMIDPVRAAHLAADILKCEPFDMLVALGWTNMEEVAAGRHPACTAA